MKVPNTEIFSPIPWNSISTHLFPFKMPEHWYMLKHKYVSSKQGKYNPGCLDKLLILIQHHLCFPIWSEGFLVLPALYPYKILESDLITIKTFMLKSYSLWCTRNRFFFNVGFNCTIKALEPYLIFCCCCLHLLYKQNIKLKI